MAKKVSSWSDGVKKVSPGKWLIRVTWTDADGKRHDTERITYADTKAEALVARTALQTEVSGSRQQGWTVAEAMARFLDTLKSGTMQAWKSNANRIVRVFGDRRLGTIEPAEVQRFMRDLPMKDSTVRNLRNCFSGVFRFARDQGEYTGRNPIRETTPRRTPKTQAQLLHEQDNPPQRAYLGDQVQRFLEALDPDLRPLQITQLLLGCRFGEVSALEWRDVDLVTGEVRIRQAQYRGTLGVTKAGKLRRTALGPYGVSLLTAHKAAMVAAGWPGHERFVFPRPCYAAYAAADRTHDMWAYWTVKKKILEAQKAAGITVDARTHAMRHTHITLVMAQQTHALDQGLAAQHRAMVGHASAAQTETYVDVRALPLVRMAAETEMALVGEKLRVVGASR
jgi:integrase